MKKINYVNKSKSKKQSVIIALVTAVLCMFIIVLSSVFTMDTSNDSYDASNEQSVTPEYTESDIGEELNSDENVKSVLNEQDVKTDNTDAAYNYKFLMPVKFEDRQIQKMFSLDTLIYSITMEDYRIHKGIDIACPVATQVYASEKGVVKSARYDDFMGYTIEIEHDEYKTVYSNLSSVDMVKEGQEVKKDEIIATTGQSASSEILDPPHLHFEVLKDGEYINPLDLIS